MPEIAIFDHYEVLTRDDGSLYELGRGAMGITYKAFDTSLRIPVALKVINSTYLNSEVARQRFVREARSAAKLRHRNVATVFHLGTEGDTWFYAMEFIDGETLDSLIKRQGPLSPAMALTITAQVARALNAAAQQELVHRDIKPANLMLVKEDDELVAKVIDFGLAKTSVPGEGEEAVTLSMGGFVGTPHFASPEQLEEKEIDVRSDIYSLGVTLWYMLAGQAPFAGSMAQVMSQHLSKPPPFEKLEHLPKPIANILRKMLAKEPADRFQAPADLRKAIEDAMDDIADAPAMSAVAPADPENFATLLEDSAMRSSAGSFETNTIIAGRYRVAESLGETNTGRLFHAYDTQKQREVRLIVLPPMALGDATALTALEREVDKLVRVQHTNLLGVIGFETVDRGSFLVLEWTDGFSLLDLLKARRELVADEALKLLAQAAAGVDHALGLGLTGLEFGLHQVYLHFPQAIEKEKILQQSVGAWPAFDLKLYPLGATRDIATSQTWAGGQTMVGGAAASSMDGGDARPRYIQALAAIIYEVLGGTLSPLVLRGAGGPTMRYTPLSTLSEEGNEVLKQALDPSRSFASASEFSAALGRLDGLQVSRREVKPPAPAPKSAASRAPLAPEKSAASQTPAFVPSQPRKPPLLLIGGAAALIVAGVAAVFLLQKPTDPLSDPPDPNALPAAITDVHEAPPNGQPSVAVVDTPPPATPVPSTPMPVATPPPPPTRQELVKAAINKAQEFEDKGDWENSLSAWLHVAKDYPEFPVGRNHLETLLEPLRKRPNPLSPKEFLDMRAMITEAAQYGVLAAMMLLADNVREQEPQQAFEWYTTASSKGYAPAMTQLGLMYSNNTLPGTPDLVKAVQFLKAAAEKGDSAGKAALGECYLKGLGVEKDEKRGLELYREAVAAGDVRATNNLGDTLSRRGTEAVKNGQSGAADFAEAFELFTKASERGSLEALGNLAVVYLKGQGVPPDPKKAAKLFEKGARAGNPFCMRGYASCLELGIGLDANLLQAKSWYRKSAEAGDKRAVEWCRENSVTFTPK